MKDEASRRNRQSAEIPAAPRGWQRLAWLGPGFIWMVSAAGSGELLFTPRIAALYGYDLLWALLAAVVLKWFINREVGRFAVSTGMNVLEGFQQLPGPGAWAVWLILIPQLVVAVSTIAGLGSSAATAVVLVVPGPLWLWFVLLVLLSTSLIYWGRFSVVQWTATALGVALALAAITASAVVWPTPSTFASGLVPRLPNEIDAGEVLPWLGFMLSGAAGMMWYSYWIAEKGYGAAGAIPSRDTRTLEPRQIETLQAWVGQMTLDTSVAVIGVLLVVIAFLILGAELLRPKGLVPGEEQVAQTLGHLLGGIWGPIGFWFMVVGIFIGFWGTVLSDQDGWMRMYASGTSVLLRRFGYGGAWSAPQRLQAAFLFLLLTLLPVLLYFAIGKPVQLLKIAGAVEAVHIPIVTGLVLYLNHTQLPMGLRPTWPTFAATSVAGLFFLLFALYYVLQLAGIVSRF